MIPHQPLTIQIVLRIGAVAQLRQDGNDSPMDVVDERYEDSTFPIRPPRLRVSAPPR